MIHGGEGKLILVKASIKRKNSYSGSIKYLGVRSIRRLYTGCGLGAADGEVGGAAW